MTDRTPEDALRAAGNAMDASATPVSASEAIDRATVRPIHSVVDRRRLLAGAVAIVCVVALFAVAVRAITGNDPARISAGLQDLAPGACVALADAPIEGRSGHTAVWTGTEMIVWGGENTAGRLADGAAFNPRTDTWRTIAPAPITGRSRHVAVWTGSEMLIWGGGDGARSLADGAAYNPSTNQWRTITPAPIRGATQAAAVWTGHELLVFGGLVQTGFTGQGTNDGAAYSPTTDTWRVLPPPPNPLGSDPHSVAWTGNVALFTASPHATGPNDTAPTPIAMYDPAANEWRSIEGIELGPVPYGNGGTASPGPVAVWDDRELLVVSGPMFPNYAIDPDTLQPRKIHAPGDNDLAESLVWTGNEVLGWLGGFTTTYDPRTDRWSSLPGPVLGRENNIAVDDATVWTGTTLLAWGGTHDTNDQPAYLNMGVAFRPGPEPTDCALRQDQAAVATPTPTTLPPPTPNDWLTIRNADAGVSIAIPPHWESLPRVTLADTPPELLAVGNRDRANGLPLGVCPHDPLPDDAVYLAVTESTGNDQSNPMLANLPPIDRPQDFRTAGGGGGSCSSATGRQGETITTASTQVWRFRDHERLFTAVLVVGGAPNTAELRNAIQALNSFAVTAPATTEPATLTDADRTAIRTAFETWLASHPRELARNYIQDYDSIADVIRSSEQAAPTERADATLRVDRIEPDTKTTAKVFFSIIDDGQVLLQREGRAILDNGTWKVSRDTVCSTMALAGGTPCPPSAK